MSGPPRQTPPGRPLPPTPTRQPAQPPTPAPPSGPRPATRPLPPTPTRQPAQTRTPGPQPQGPTRGGADGTKQEPGVPRHRRVFKLKPVTYRIKLIFLGEKRIRHAPMDTPGYHCTFELQRGQSKLDALDVLPNLVRGANPPADTVPAALPLDQGGDNSAIAGENAYRVLITDNHGTREDDDMNDSGQDTESRPANYTRHQFDEDIYPAVPLRVVVRKYVGSEPEDIDVSQVKLLWEIKDTAEATDRFSDPRVRQFISEFLAGDRLNAAVPGDDNASTAYGGLRDPRGGTSGVKAERVLFALPYLNQPPVDRLMPPPTPAFVATPQPPPHRGPAPPPGQRPAARQPQLPAPSQPAVNNLENIQDHPNPLTPVPLQDAYRAGLTLTAVDEQAGDRTVRVAVCDVIFRPKPISGDSYRFLLRLVDASGTDIRQTRDAGRSVRLEDDAGQEIPHPRAYTTGAVVVWRKIEIGLLVWTNKLSSSSVNWNEVQRACREAYIELTQPLRVHELTRDGWRQAMIKYFKNAGVGLTERELSNPNNYGDSDFRKAFYPGFLQRPPNTWKPYTARLDRFCDQGCGRKTEATRYNCRECEWLEDLENTHLPKITQQIIRDTCTELNLRPPQQASRQLGIPGYCVLLARKIYPGADLGGLYVPECQFYLRNEAYASTVFQHELGHGLYLRHSLTSPMQIDGEISGIYQSSSGNRQEVFFCSMEEDCYPADHDQNNSVDCVMAYGNQDIKTNFCALCQLTLRHYDTLALRKSRPDLIWNGLSPAQIVFVENTSRVQLTEKVNPTLRRGTSHRFAVIGKFEPNPNSLGTVAKILTTLPNVAINLVEPTNATSGKVDADWDGDLIRVDIAADASPGHYTLQFKQAGVTRATLDFRVA